MVSEAIIGKKSARPNRSKMDQTSSGFDVGSVGRFRHELEDRMNTRRELINGGMFFAGSILVVGAMPNMASAGFFDDIAATVVGGIGFAKDNLETVAKTALDVAGTTAEVAQPFMKVLAATPLGRDPRFAAAAATTQVVSDIRKGMQRGPIQAAPIVANASERPKAMPVTVQRPRLPMPVSSSIDDELREDPYGYMHRNQEMIDDYLDSQDLQLEASNYTLQPLRIHGVPILTNRFERRGYYPSRLQYLDRSGGEFGLPSMNSMVYFGDDSWR